MTGKPLPQLPGWHCFACDPTHDKGLHLTFTAFPPNRIRTKVTLSDDYTGIDSIVHGGILATIFDELMSWGLFRWRRKLHVTAHLEQRMRLPVLAGVPLVAEAEVEESHSASRARVTARMWAADDPDTILAQSTALFLVAPDSALDTVPADQRADLEALFASFAATDA